MTNLNDGEEKNTEQNKSSKNGWLEIQSEERACATRLLCGGGSRGALGVQRAHERHEGLGDVAVEARADLEEGARELRGQLAALLRRDRALLLEVGLVRHEHKRRRCARQLHGLVVQLRHGRKRLWADHAVHL